MNAIGIDGKSTHKVRHQCVRQPDQKRLTGKPKSTASIPADSYEPIVTWLSDAGELLSAL
ncbi:MAG: hypothetical protein ACLR23_12720 [Clostridia bacterium]